jgi:YggT family protein
VITLILIRTVATLVTVFTWMIIIRALLSFIRPSGYNRLYQDVVGTLDVLTEPLVAPIRGVVPLVGMFDFSPLIALILLQVVGNLVVQLLAGIR